MLAELQREAHRQDRSISWLMQQAWKIARGGIDRGSVAEPPLAAAVNVHRGKLTNPAVAETFGLEYSPLFPT